MNKKSTFTLLGNPNCGKTAVFNLLTGLDQKVSNYPGVTVEKKLSSVKIDDYLVSFEDFPGTYSCNPQSLDEKIVHDSLFSWMDGSIAKPDGIIYVADSTNLRRNLYLCTQLMALNIPIILLLNMSDLTDPNSLVNIEKLTKNLNLFDIISFSAAKKTGQTELKKSITNLLSNDVNKVDHNVLRLSKENFNLLSPIINVLSKEFSFTDSFNESLSLTLLSGDKYYENLNCSQSIKDDILKSKLKVLSSIDKSMRGTLETIEPDLRYGFIDSILDKSKYIDTNKVESISFSEKIDRVLTHAFFGPIIYVGILYFIFQSIFTYASAPMDFIDGSVSSFGNTVYSLMPAGMARDLLVDGIIAGVGGIVIFLPQILLLMLFMILLEDTGYMTRISFLMDKYMRKMGLHGKSILPIMSGYACAIPGIISTRTIDSWKERLVTILILPLISCAARLPVYVLMIGAFIPDIYIYDMIGLQGLVMVIMYFLGTITAFILAKFFSSVLSERSNPTFIMELPPYRKPILRSVSKQLYTRGKLFLVNAGQIIMAISIIIWVLVSFPKNDGEYSSIHDSYAGRIGHFVEPSIQPLGFDWKIGIGLITSFAAREVVVSTLSTIYNVEDEGETMVNLKEAMINDVDPRTGKNVFTPLVALSLMVFYVYAAQCMATFAVVRTETNTWKWPIFMIIYMTALAYIMSFIIFNGGRLLGFN
jgi:ferrous iron transport protein B